MTEKNRSPPLSDGTSTEAIEPTILFQKGQVHLYGIKIRYPQHGRHSATWSSPEKTKQNREESTDAWRYSPEASTFIQTYRGRMILWLSSLPKPEKNILTLRNV